MNPFMCSRVTRHTRGHTTWQASLYTDSLSYSFHYSHCNHGMWPATRSLHSHKSGITPAVTRLVTRQSCGHPKPLRSFVLIGIFAFYSAFSVASSQRLVLLYLVHFINRLHSQVTRMSRGHNTTINKLRIRGGLRTSSKYSVASCSGSYCVPILHLTLFHCMRSLYTYCSSFSLMCFVFTAHFLSILSTLRSSSAFVPLCV